MNRKSWKAALCFGFAAGACDDCFARTAAATETTGPAVLAESSQMQSDHGTTTGFQLVYGQPPRKNPFTDIAKGNPLGTPPHGKPFIDTDPLADCVP